MEKKIKVGLDLHGVIDSQPEKFVRLAKAIIAGGGEVYICTGSRNDQKLFEQLVSYNNGFKWWTDIFSVTDHLIASGVDHIPSADGGIQCESVAWDVVKGKWAEYYNIDFHIDDSPVYGEYFHPGIYLKFNERTER